MSGVGKGVGVENNDRAIDHAINAMTKAERVEVQDRNMDALLSLSHNMALS
jgi:hypothetical protein